LVILTVGITVSMRDHTGLPPSDYSYFFFSRLVFGGEETLNESKRIFWVQTDLKYDKRDHR